MIDGALFDKLEQIARTIRKKPQAFGGINSSSRAISSSFPQ